MNKADYYYIRNLNKILKHGYVDENPRPMWKDGTPAHSRFITQVYEEYDISKGEFPITTLRNTATKTGIREILWIYQKQSNLLSDAHSLGIKWWDEWDIGDGTIGERYGATIKRYDLMNKLLYGLEKDPFSRRHIINMYQENDLQLSMGLHPCAYETIWSVRRLNGTMYLDLTLNQRSNDYIMAGYINKAQYVSLQMMVCSHLGYNIGKFAHFVQNLHIYDRHIDAAKEILNRRGNIFTRLFKRSENPYIEIKNRKSFYDFTIDDFLIKNVKNIKEIKSELEIAI